MADILETIVAYKNQEVERYKKELSQDTLVNRVDILRKAQTESMKAALMASNTGIIAEFKRKSPSKGWINREASPSIIPHSYQNYGATALSILTDTHFFGGNCVDIRSARLSKVNIPILYKNFIIDEYQLFQARLCGASAVLLIAACLTKTDCLALQQTAHELGLEVLLEMHSQEELEYAEQTPDLCGINNRHLGSFVTDVETSFRLAEYLPKEAVQVSESGLSDPLTVKQLRSAGFRGFLMGEHFMKSADPGEALQAFIQQL
jgi:indole-3-glycerol phosphate synthase